MIIVIDTNILISALIKDSLTRRIIVSSGMNFCYPEISLHELRRHKNMVMEKSGLDEKEFESLLEKILKYVVLIPTEVIKDHLEKAKDIMSKIDPKDVVFMAVALAFENAVIWSDDRDFEKQISVGVVKTAQFARLFGK